MAPVARKFSSKENSEFCFSHQRLQAPNFCEGWLKPHVGLIETLIFSYQQISNNVQHIATWEISKDFWAGFDYKKKFFFSLQRDTIEHMTKKGFALD